MEDILNFQLFDMEWSVCFILECDLEFQRSNQYINVKIQFIFYRRIFNVYNSFRLSSVIKNIQECGRQLKRLNVKEKWSPCMTSEIQEFYSLSVNKSSRLREKTVQIQDYYNGW